MGISIRDVAKRAGVSISTVSRVMNNSATVDDEKVMAVKEAMEFYDYQPNQFGRGLVKQNSKMIGVYFAHTYGLFDSTYNLELLKGIQKVLDRFKYSMVLIHEDGGYQEGKKFLDYASQKKIDGLILSSIAVNTQAEIAYKKLLEDRFPMTYIGRSFHKNGSNVYAQYERYMYQMIEKFYMAGHKKILIYIYELHHGYIKDVLDKVGQHMVDMHVYIEYQSGDIYINAREQIRDQIHFYVTEKGCTAIGYPHMDHMNLILGICQELKISIPKDLSIIGVEHREMEGSTYFPSINAFYVPAKEMGEAAAEMLIQGIEKGTISEISRELKTSYMARDSVLTHENE